MKKKRDLKSYPNAWLKFFKSLENFNNKSVKEYDQKDLLGYAISKTKINIIISEFSNDGIDQEYHYKDKKKNCPSRHPELELCRKWIRQYGSEEAYNFINYCLNETKFKTITSLYYFNNAKFFAGYQKSKIICLNKKIDRNTKLPEQLKIIPNINTYGELSFWLQAYPDDKEKLNKIIDINKLLEKII